MNLLRTPIIRLTFLFSVGLSFLNMNFFLAEVSMLKESYSRDAVENIAKLLSMSMTEEEQDTAHTSDNPLKSVSLLSEHLIHLQFEETGVSLKLRVLSGKNSPHGGYSQIFTPPPDIS